MTSILSVVHHFETGWHSFTSPQLPGLFLCGPDEDAAALRRALPDTIRALIAAAEGQAVLVRRADSFRAAAGGRAAAGDMLHFLVTNRRAERSKTWTGTDARQDDGGAAGGGDGQG